MTKEQAIEALKEHKRQIDKKYINTRNSKAIETVLSMLEEQDKEIQFQNDINKTELDRHNKAEKNLKGIIKKKNKIIDLMAERVLLTEEEWKEIKEKNIYNVIKKDTHKLIKQYFENKAKELLNK